MALHENINRVQSDIESTTKQYIDEIHDEFCEIYRLADAMNNSRKPISDEDLEYVLIDLPLKLFTASEYLAKLSSVVEALKLENIQKEADIRKDINESIDLGRMKCTQHELKLSIEVALAENKASIICLNRVIKQIEKQLTYCRELIMSAKKIWDARRRTEAIIPINEPNIEDLPEITRNQYIKG